MALRKDRKIRRIAMKNLRPRMDIGGWNKRAVFALDDEGKIAGWFESALDAEKKTGICKENIRKVCHGRRKKAGGFRWEFA